MLKYYIAKRTYKKIYVYILKIREYIISFFIFLSLRIIILYKKEIKISFVTLNEKEERYFEADYTRTKRRACVTQKQGKRAHWDRVDHVTAGIRDKAHKRRAPGPRFYGNHELNIRVARGFY